MAMVYLLCGPVASGKTCFAQRLQQEGAVILSYDELMLKLYDHCLGPAHDDTVLRMERYFYTLAEQLIAAGVSVVLDFGFWHGAERAEAKTYFQTRGIAVQLYYFAATEAVRQQWLQQRNRALAGATERVYLIEENLRQFLDTKFEIPTADEIDQWVEANDKPKLS